MGTATVLSARWRATGPVSAARVDAVVAMLLLAGALGALAMLSRDDSPWVAAGACAVLAGAVAIRRHAPLTAALAAVAGLVAYELASHDPNGAFPPVAVVLAFYAVGRGGAPRRQPVRVALTLAMALGACVTISVDLGSSLPKAASSWLAVAVVPLVIGIGIARRNALSRRLTEAAAQLRAEQDINAARAKAEERNRVARDLHDVVAHSVSVMVVQAGAARLVCADKPAEADNALAVIGSCGRDALADLRRIVGVLRRGADPDFGCGAGLADLARLAARMQFAGVTTHVSVDGDAPIPPAVDLVAYRVVQEALTNVVKHAGAEATADVRVTVNTDSVTVDVTNTGGILARPAATISGHGLVGMRERVTAYGGDLSAGPQPGAGYQVRAQIPRQAGSPGHHDASDVPDGSDRRWWPRRVSGWRPIPARLGDAAVIVGWLIAMEGEAATSSARQGPWAANAAAVAVMALAGIWRRRHPLLFLAVIGGLAAALSGGLTSLDRSTITGLYSLAVSLFTVAAWAPRTRAILGLACWTIGASVLAVAQRTDVGGFAGGLVMGVVVWTAGRLWRAQRVLAADLTETTTRLATERDDRARLAVATERTRIARELHGLVAHGVVTMVVQAETARTLLAHQPARAADAIRAIEQTGRDALTQLRRILGVLRSDPPDQPSKRPLSPSPPVPPPGERASAWMPEEVLT